MMRKCDFSLLQNLIKIHTQRHTIFGLFFILIFFNLNVFSQVEKVVLLHKSNNLAEAKRMVDSLNYTENATKDAEILYLRALVYESIYASKDSTWKSIAIKALMESAQNYQLALKGTLNTKYNKLASNRLDSVISKVLISEAQKQMDAKNAKVAVDLFDTYLKIVPNDTLIQFRLAIAAEKSSNFAKAKENYVAIVDKCKNKDIYKSLILISLNEILNINDANTYISKAKKKFPSDKDFDLFEIESLIKAKKDSIALKKIDSLATKIPQRKTELLLSKAVVYEMRDSAKLAEKTYLELISLDNKFVAGYSNLGIFYYNQAKLIFDKINKMDYVAYQKNGNLLLSDAEKLAKKSLNYLEMSYQLEYNVQIKEMIQVIAQNLRVRDKTTEIDRKRN